QASNGFARLGIHQKRADLFIELVRAAADPNQRRPKIPPTLFTRIIGHLAIAAASQPTAPNLAEMPHHVREHIPSSSLHDLIKAFREIEAPTFWMAFLQFSNQLRRFVNPSAELQAILCPFVLRHLPSIKFPPKFFVLFALPQCE